MRPLRVSRARVWCFPAFPAWRTLGSIVERSEAIFFVSSVILEGGADDVFDALSAEASHEVRLQLDAQLLLNLTNALL